MGYAAIQTSAEGSQLMGPEASATILMMLWVKVYAWAEASGNMLMLSIATQMTNAHQETA